MQVGNKTQRLRKEVETGYCRLCTTSIGALAQPLMGRLKVPTFQTSPNKQFSLVLGSKKYIGLHT